MMLMKAISLLVLLPAVCWAAGDDSGDHGDDAPLCSTVNVTDAATCTTWCGNKTAEWTYASEHGDFEEFHVDYLKFWECHCEEEDGGATRRRTEEEQHCMIPYELPTCKSMGLADCGENATKTCAELCFSVGLGLENGNTTTSTERRFLDHVTGQHFCAHHEGEEDHDRRGLAEDEHDHEEEVTICYCNADTEAAEKSTIACSDADLAEDHDSGAAGASLLAAGGVMVMALLW